MVFCSRSGRPQDPWLEPDINDHLRSLRLRDAPGVVAVPIGFVSDHMEVIYDLDHEAQATAEGRQLKTGYGLGLRQRGWPMVEMMKRASAENADIVWGV